MVYKCDICNRETDQVNVYKLYNYLSLDGWKYFCSPSCLVEGAWELKVAQDKLSKSKQVEYAKGRNGN